MELIGRSKELWAGMNAAVDAETGYRRCGVVSLLPDDGARAFAEDWLDKVRGRRGVDARIVSAAEAAALTPGGTASFVGGLYQPSDACAEPVLAAPAIAEGARRKGAAILQNCAVRSVETSGGAISGVVTERGRIGCQAVVLAGGYWSSLFARSLGASTSAVPGQRFDDVHPADGGRPARDVGMGQWLCLAAGGLTAATRSARSTGFRR